MGGPTDGMHDHIGSTAAGPSTSASAAASSGASAISPTTTSVSHLQQQNPQLVSVNCLRLSGEVVTYFVDPAIIRTVRDFKVYLHCLEGIPLSLLSVFRAVDIDATSGGQTRKCEDSEADEEVHSRDLLADFDKYVLEKDDSPLVDVADHGNISSSSTEEEQDQKSSCDGGRPRPRRRAADASVELRLVINGVRFPDEVHRDIAFLDSLGLETCRQWVFLEAFKDHALWQATSDKSALFCRLCKQHREAENVLLALAESPKLIEFCDPETRMPVQTSDALPQFYYLPSTTSAAAASVAAVPASERESQPSSVGLKLPRDHEKASSQDSLSDLRLGCPLSTCAIERTGSGTTVGTGRARMAEDSSIVYNRKTTVTSLVSDSNSNANGHRDADDGPRRHRDEHGSAVRGTPASSSRSGGRVEPVVNSRNEESLYGILESMRERNTGMMRSELLPTCKRPVQVRADTSFEHLIASTRKPNKRTPALSAANGRSTSSADASTGGIEDAASRSSSSTSAVRAAVSLDAQQQSNGAAANELPTPTLVPLRDVRGGSKPAGAGASSRVLPEDEAAGLREDEIADADSESGADDGGPENRENHAAVVDSTACRVTGYCPLLHSRSAVLGNPDPNRPLPSSPSSVSSAGSLTTVPPVELEGEAVQVPGTTTVEREPLVGHGRENGEEGQRLLQEEAEEVRKQQEDEEKAGGGGAESEENAGDSSETGGADTDNCYDPHVYSYYTFLYDRKNEMRKSGGAAEETAEEGTRTLSTTDPVSGEKQGERDDSAAGDESEVSAISKSKSPARAGSASPRWSSGAVASSSSRLECLFRGKNDELSKMMLQESTPLAARQDEHSDVESLQDTWTTVSDRLPAMSSLLYTVFSEADNALYSCDTHEHSSPSKLKRSLSSDTMLAAYNNDLEASAARDRLCLINDAALLSRKGRHEVRRETQAAGASSRIGRACGAEGPRRPQQQNAEGQGASAAPGGTGGGQEPPFGGYQRGLPWGYSTVRTNESRTYRSPNFGGIFRRRRGDTERASLTGFARRYFSGRSGQRTFLAAGSEFLDEMSEGAIAAEEKEIPTRMSGARSSSKTSCMGASKRPDGSTTSKRPDLGSTVIATKKPVGTSGAPVTCFEVLEEHEMGMGSSFRPWSDDENAVFLVRQKHNQHCSKKAVVATLNSTPSACSPTTVGASTSSSTTLPQHLSTSTSSRAAAVKLVEAMRRSPPNGVVEVENFEDRVAAGAGVEKYQVMRFDASFAESPRSSTAAGEGREAQVAETSHDDTIAPRLDESNESTTTLLYHGPMTLSEYLSLMSSSGEDTSPTASDPTTICPLSSIDQEGSSVMDEDCGADVTSPVAGSPHSRSRSRAPSVSTFHPMTRVASPAASEDASAGKNPATVGPGPRQQTSTDDANVLDSSDSWSCNPIGVDKAAIAKFDVAEGAQSIKLFDSLEDDEKSATLRLRQDHDNPDQEVVSVLDPKGDCNEGGSSSTGSEDEDHDDGANADPSCVVDEDDVRHFAAAVDATESAHGERGTECESDAGREPDGEGTFRYNLHYDMLNYVDETGRTPLMWLLVWKQERAARALIRRADFRMLNVKDKWGGMVLTLAVPLHALFLETVRRRSRDLELECLEDVLKTGFPAFRLAVKLGLAEKREHILRQQERILSFLCERKRALRDLDTGLGRGGGK
mmetsp:Transcript_21564/g.54404  ORF Transcript_21564/g.54404 Transcript_21564/m.54404 type:complete len:1679 (+) Transcript_21564:434-5470(+)